MTMRRQVGPAHHDDDDVDAEAQPGLLQAGPPPPVAQRRRQKGHRVPQPHLQFELGVSRVTLFSRCRSWLRSAG